MRPPEEITLLDVVEAIDGRGPVFRCTEIRQQGPLAQEPQAYRLPCGIHVAMARAEKAWRDALRSQTLADLARQYTHDVDRTQQQRSQEWIAGRMRLMPKKPYSSPKKSQ